MKLQRWQARKINRAVVCLSQGFRQTQVLSARPLSNCSSERMNNVDPFFARGLRKFLLRLCSRPELNRGYDKGNRKT